MKGENKMITGIKTEAEARLDAIRYMTQEDICGVRIFYDEKKKWCVECDVIDYDKWYFEEE